MFFFKSYFNIKDKKKNTNTQIKQTKFNNMQSIFIDKINFHFKDDNLTNMFQSFIEFYIGLTIPDVETLSLQQTSFQNTQQQEQFFKYISSNGNYHRNVVEALFHSLSNNESLYFSFKELVLLLLYKNINKNTLRRKTEYTDENKKEIYETILRELKLRINEFHQSSSNIFQSPFLF